MSYLKNTERQFMLYKHLDEKSMAHDAGKFAQEKEERSSTDGFLK
jgi:hypothetical protein